MEIILQDSGLHASLFLVGSYSNMHSCFNQTNIRCDEGQEVSWDSISFRRNSFASNRWIAVSQREPQVFFRRDEQQRTMLSLEDEAEVREVWARGLNAAAYTSFQALPRQGEKPVNIRVDFNCRTGVIVCLRAMGLSYDLWSDFKADRGTQYNFESLE